MVLIIIAGWPEFNDWQWASAKEEARSLITKYETERDLQDKAQAAAQGGSCRDSNAGSVSAGCASASPSPQPLQQHSAKTRFG